MENEFKTGQLIANLTSHAVYRVGDYSEHHGAFRCCTLDGKRNVGIVLEDDFTNDPEKVEAATIETEKRRVAREIKLALEKKEDDQKLSNFRQALNALMESYGVDIYATQTSGDDQGVSVAVVLSLGAAEYQAEEI